MSRACRFLQYFRMLKSWLEWVGDLLLCRVEKAVASVRRVWSPKESVQPKVIYG